MCEFDPACTKVSDPDAKALSQNPREKDAVIIVICPRQHHLLAAVYDLPLRGLVLCAPSFSSLHRSLFVSPSEPDAVAHFHPMLDPLTDLDPHDAQHGRCRCGTWCYSRYVIERGIEAWSPENQAWRNRNGEPLAGQEELVKIRHSNGQVTPGGRALADSLEGAKVIGTINRKRYGRPYVLGSWVTPADRG